MTMTDEMKRLISDFKQIRSERSTWNVHFQILGEYISQNKQNFEASPHVGEFLTDEIFDSTGTFAAHNSASSLLGMLWAGSAKQSIEIAPPDDLDINQAKKLEEFYNNMTQTATRAMDDPKANLMISLDEYMLDQMIFGTSGVGVEKGIESDLLYAPYGVKEMYIIEGKAGKVKQVWLYNEWKASRIVSEYGEENVSEQVRKAFKDNKEDKFKVITVIRDREQFKAEKGKLAMPVEALHVEEKSGKLLREDGFEEMPINVGRFRKLNYEQYGRSAGMMALPDIREANALREGVIVATEKSLDPPQGVYSDGGLGGGIIDTSAGAINVFNPTANGQAPIFPIVTVGSIQDAVARLEELKNNIAQHFSIDRLLDFNNEQQMTLGEAQIRNSIRTASLSSLFSRQITEVFTPLVERSVNMLWRMGKFGVTRGSVEEEELLKQGEEPKYVPDVIQERLEKGLSIYEVRYKTQASQASKAESFLAITEVLGIASEVSAVDPTVLNRIDFHEAIKEIGDIRAIPPNIIVADDVFEEKQEQASQQAAVQQGLEQAESVGRASRDLAQAGDMLNGQDNA